MLKHVLATLAFAAYAAFQVSTASAQMIDCRRVPMELRRQVGCPMPRPQLGLGLRLGNMGVGVRLGGNTGVGPGYIGAAPVAEGEMMTGHESVVMGSPGVGGTWTEHPIPGGGHRCFNPKSGVPPQADGTNAFCPAGFGGDQ